MNILLRGKKEGLEPRLLCEWIGFHSLLGQSCLLLPPHALLLLPLSGDAGVFQLHLAVQLSAVPLLSQLGSRGGGTIAEHVGWLEWGMEGEGERYGWVMTL